jgi:hypothetical protein
MIGSAACLILGGKSFFRYRRSRDELSKYMAWFFLVIGVSLAAFSVPSLFTLNAGTLLVTGLAGEVFFYGGMMAQAAIVWFLMLRPRFPIYFVTVPVGIVGLASWLYSLSRTKVLVESNFITFLNPRASTLVIAILMIGLFVPVGLYFLREAPRQTDFKAKLNSVAVSLAYLGIGLIGGGFEIATGQIMTRTSVFSNTIFFSVLLIGVIWPRRTKTAEASYK